MVYLTQTVRIGTNQQLDDFHRAPIPNCKVQRERFAQLRTHLDRLQKLQFSRILETPYHSSPIQTITLPLHHLCTSPREIEHFPNERCFEYMQYEEV